MNIKLIISILPISDKFPLIPVLNPSVLSFEDISNKKLSKYEN